MRKSRLIGTLCSVVFTFITLSANAVLIGRLETSPGSGNFQAYFDDELNITWAADANINGADNWPNQIAWVGSLTLGGVSGWRLPNMDTNGDDTIVNCSSTGTSQTACMDNEYGHLYWYGAGTMMGSGVTAASPGPFNNVQDGRYWSGTDSPTNPLNASTFSFTNTGSNNTSGKQGVFSNFAWAVHDGDVGVVPVPAALWLFSFGLLGLIGMQRLARCKRA